MLLNNNIADPHTTLLFASHFYNWTNFVNAVDYWNDWAQDTISDPFRPAYCTFLYGDSPCLDITAAPDVITTLTRQEIVMEMCAMFANAMVETDGFATCAEYLPCYSGIVPDTLDYVVGGKAHIIPNFPDPLDTTANGACNQSVDQTVNCNVWAADYGNFPKTLGQDGGCGENICQEVYPTGNMSVSEWTSCGGVHGGFYYYPEVTSAYDFSSNAGCENNGGDTQIACPAAPTSCHDWFGNTFRSHNNTPAGNLEMEKVGCFYGRGTVQLTTPCNYGAMSYYTRNMPYFRDTMNKKDFCSDPDLICDDGVGVWISSIYYWAALVKKGLFANNLCFGTSTANYSPAGGDGRHPDLSRNITVGTRTQWYAWFVLEHFPNENITLTLQFPNATFLNLTKENYMTINWDTAGHTVYNGDKQPPTSCGQSQPPGCVTKGGSSNLAGFCCTKNCGCNITAPDNTTYPGKYIWTNESLDFIERRCSSKGHWCDNSEANCAECDGIFCALGVPIAANTSTCVESSGSSDGCGAGLLKSSNASSCPVGCPNGCFFQVDQATFCGQCVSGSSDQCTTWNGVFCGGNSTGGGSTTCSPGLTKTTNATTCPATCPGCFINLNHKTLCGQCVTGAAASCTAWDGILCSGAHV